MSVIPQSLVLGLDRAGDFLPTKLASPPRICMMLYLVYQLKSYEADSVL